MNTLHANILIANINDVSAHRDGLDLISKQQKAIVARFLILRNPSSSAK